MCIPHGATGSIDSGYVEKKAKKHVEKVSKEVFEKGDPNFVDERTLESDKPEKEKSMCDRIFGTDS